MHKDRNRAAVEGHVARVAAGEERRDREEEVLVGRAAVEATRMDLVAQEGVVHKGLEAPVVEGVVRKGLEAPVVVDACGGSSSKKCWFFCCSMRGGFVYKDGVIE